MQYMNIQWHKPKFWQENSKSKHFDKEGKKKNGKEKLKNNGINVKSYFLTGKFIQKSSFRDVLRLETEIRLFQQQQQQKKNSKRIKKKKKGTHIGFLNHVLPVW